MQGDGQDSSESAEVRVCCEERKASPLRDGADEETGVRSLYATRAAGIEMLGGPFEVCALEWFVGEGLKRVAQPFERFRRTKPTEQFLANGTDHRHTSLVNA